MKNLVLLLAVVVGTGVYWMNRPEQEVEAHSEAGFRRLLAQSYLPATELAVGADRFPKLVANIPRNRSYHVTGVVKDFLITGVSQDKADIVLYDDDGRDVVVRLDLNKYYTIRTNSYHRARGKFERMGSELVFLGMDNRIRIVLYAIGDRFNQEARFGALLPHAIRFEAEGRLAEGKIRMVRK
jgi:hypothetical protein